MEAHILRQQTHFYSYYKHLPREILLSQLQSAVEQQQYWLFAKWFKEAVDDMDAQYLEIREARRTLARWDPFDRGCDIDPVDDNVLCDERVDWSVNEPEIAPAAKLPGFLYSKVPT